MFKKGPDIDKKKLLLKASDVKKESSTRLKHFKTLIEHLEYNELPGLFKTHFSFIYHTFIDTFSTFDCNSKQRRDDLECILFMLERILIFNPELIKKRWQFYSITFVMQKLLHQNNTWQLRQEGVRLFVLWYQILCDETNSELQTMFGSLVLGVVPQSSLPVTDSPSNSSAQQQGINPQHYPVQRRYSNSSNQLPVKLCSIDPLVPMSANEQLPGDETSFYLDSLLQFMITQPVRPFWASPEDAKRNQELGFAFTFNMFKRIYLPHLFPNFDLHLDSSTRSYLSNHSMHMYADETGDHCHYISQSKYDNDQARSPTSITSASSNRDPLHIDLRQSNHFISSPSPIVSQSSIDHERTISLSNYQAIVIKWLTRILRQDMIPGQDELIRAGGSSERKNNREASSSNNESNDYSNTNDGNTSINVQGIETSSREMQIARRVIGTWPENIEVIHELFRRAFLNYYQPASMKRVVNVYKEWICNGGPNQVNPTSGRASKLGYTSFSDLLQVFVLNSSSAFISRVHNPTMLDEQVEMCKRIMNIYRYMVMKIYMNTSTWEQLLNVMLSITERLFPINPPEKKENTIGGRIAPAFFQTFIVSWIRANLYVHISGQMWNEFHRVMKSLVRWRELVEEWHTTMGSLTRVLVKHVYGLSLTDLPLDRPQERRKRPKATKSFSTAESVPKKSDQTATNPTDPNTASPSKTTSTPIGTTKTSRSGSIRLPPITNQRDVSRGLARSNSYGMLFHEVRLYYSSKSLENGSVEEKRTMRKIKSEYCLFESEFVDQSGRRSSSHSHNDVIDGSSLKDSNLIIEHDPALELHHSSNNVKTPTEVSKQNPKKTPDSKIMSDKCVLLGGSVRGWTPENSVIMWRRMLGLFGNINQIEDVENHLIAIKCLESILNDFTKTRENLGVSIDNQSTPDEPKLIPPYTYFFAWLLEATHLPRQYRDSRLLAQELLCSMSIRRHDTELSPSYYSAFYEVLQRALISPDPYIHASIIRNASRLFSLELPGCTSLVQGLYERSRSILVGPDQQVQKSTTSYPNAFPTDQAVQLLNCILSLNKPIKKLMVLKLDLNDSMNLVTPGDIKAKVFETLLLCNTRSVILDSQTRCKSLCSMAMHVYQELNDKNDSLDTEKLFDIIMTELQDLSNKTLFRIRCDLLRLFADHAPALVHSRPTLISAMIQILCQLIVRFSSEESNKEPIHFLLICLEDWCLAVGKAFLLKSTGQLSTDDDDTISTKSLDDSLITIVLRSLECVINDEQFMDDASLKGTRGSLSTSRASDLHSGSSSGGGGGSSKQLLDRNPISDRILSGESHQLTSNDQDQPADPIESSSSKVNKNPSAIKLACKVSHHKIITYLGHFPLRQVGAASMSCCVNESDYLTPIDGQELTDFKNTPGLFILVIDNNTIISFIGTTRYQDGSPRPLHLIIRNLSGKYSWDVSNTVMGFDDQLGRPNPDDDFIAIDSDSFQEVSRGSMKYDSDFNEDGNSSSSMSSRSSSSRDCICDILHQLSISLTSGQNLSSISSSYQNMQRKRNSAQSVSNPKYKIAQAEETMIALLTNQRFQELNYCEKSDDLDKVVLNLNGCKSMASPATASGISTSGKRLPANNELASDQISSSLKSHQRSQNHNMISFEQCRQLIQQLGYLSWEKRCKIDSLSKSARLLREFKNLDAQSGRETHKIAVIYVAHGQEDKTSILMNTNGSRAFEDFVAGLGWEVNLSSHLGFKGGLQSNKSTGETSPYYCNATTEVMFHVSTRIPINAPADDESLNKKLRHLGNDEIHIVWSEHTRDYRRGIIPTEFGDVIIAIYPMLTFQGYFRVQISSKQDVPMFGPLYDNCIVHQTSLASLVRATAINASRAKRLKLPYYQSQFEERGRLINLIVQNHREKLSFEEFALQLYSNSGDLTTTGSAATNKNTNSQPGATVCCN